MTFTATRGMSLCCHTRQYSNYQQSDEGHLLNVRFTRKLPFGIAPSPPLHYRYRYGRRDSGAGLNLQPRMLPSGISPPPWPGDTGPCAETPTSAPVCPPLGRFQCLDHTTPPVHPRPIDAACIATSQGQRSRLS